MVITTYKTRYNEERIITLVKEASSNYPEFTRVDSPERCVEMVEAVFDASNLPEEHFWLLALDGARKVSGIFEVSHGTITSALVHPREIFIRAILAGAASIIIVHNHPSGELDISEDDRKVTKTVGIAGDLLGIRLDDHLIIGDGNFISAM